jgi:hypothetical protein
VDSGKEDQQSNNGEVPVETPQTVWHYLWLEAGSGNCTYIEAAVTGFVDGWIES